MSNSNGNTTLGTGLYPPRLEDGSAFPTAAENARLLRNLAPDLPPEVPTPTSNVFRFGAPLTDSPQVWRLPEDKRRRDQKHRDKVPYLRTPPSTRTRGALERGVGIRYGEGYGGWSWGVLLRPP
ncbi:hypothetical protein NMY22_g20090 [Coprinellus aureogranulatus]|nr:hypothetical protein NMY22_g20090 [Coprinellus aureogranulatus]